MPPLWESNALDYTRWVGANMQNYASTIWANANAIAIGGDSTQRHRPPQAGGSPHAKTSLPIWIYDQKSIPIANLPIPRCVAY